MQPLVNMEMVVNEISIKNNNLPAGNFNIEPVVKRNIGELDENHMVVELVAEIVNTEEHPFPVDIRVSIAGKFETGKIPKEEVDHFLKIQAVQILFFFFWSMVTNITTNAMLPPIVLPVVDVRTLFDDE